MHSSDQQRIEQVMMQLLAQRGVGKSLCPSEVARALDETDWRELMADVRQVAADLLAQGKIRVTQGETEVHPLERRGPIRLRLPHDCE
jgi:hypothetical protein